MNAVSLPTVADSPGAAPEVTVTNASTVPAAAAVVPPQAGWIAFELPISKRGGKRMTKPLGSHFRRAQFVAGGDQSKFAFAVAVVTCILESKPGAGDFKTPELEELDDLDMGDASFLTRQALIPLA